MQWSHMVLLVACLGTLTGVVQAQPQAILFEDFESFPPGNLPTPSPPQSGWSTGNGSSFLWHVATSGECGSLTRMLAYNLGSSTCNFQNGNSHIGRAYSPEFTLTGQGPYSLSLKYRRQVDPTSDTTKVWVTSASTTQHLYLLGTISQNATTPQVASFILWNSQPGQLIRLEFEFSANFTGNAGFGWMVDEISVTGATRSAWTDQGGALAGTAGPPVLVGTGTLAAGSSNGLQLSNAAPSALSAVLYGLGGGAAPFKGGVLQPSPPLGPVFLVTGSAGGLDVPFTMTAGVPPGTELWVQWAIQDAGAVAGVALSNAIRGLTP